MSSLRKSGSLVAVWIKSEIAAWCSFCPDSRNCGTNSTTTFMPRFYIEVLDMVVLESQDQLPALTQLSPIFVDWSLYTFNIPRCSAWCRPSRMWITFNRSLTIFEALVLHIHLHCTHWKIPESFLNHLNSFHGGKFKFNIKFDADSLLYSLNHFEWASINAHSTASTAPQIRTVKSSLFMHAHSSLLSLATRLCQCCTTIFFILTMAGLFTDRPCIQGVERDENGELRLHCMNIITVPNKDWCEGQWPKRRNQCVGFLSQIWCFIGKPSYLDKWRNLMAWPAPPMLHKQGLYNHLVIMSKL